MAHTSPIVAASEANIRRAVEILTAEGLVSFPTETVYGLGANATSDAAITKIFKAKSRPQFNPLILHVQSIEKAQEIAEFSERAHTLASAFWPGPLTLVLPRKRGIGVSWLASAGLETIAIRCPAHPIAQALLQRANFPIAAPSANLSGTVSPTTALHVAEGLGQILDLILDGGPCTQGIESTIIGLYEPRPTLLRAGSLPRQPIEALIGPLHQSSDHETAPHSPGRLKRHYATAKPIRLNAKTVSDDEALLAFGTPLPGARHTLNLSPSSNLTEAAANLFAMLRNLDATDARAIAVMPIAHQGLGEAINDRLIRAAAID